MPIIIIIIIIITIIIIIRVLSLHSRFPHLLSKPFVYLCNCVTTYVFVYLRICAGLHNWSRAVKPAPK